MILRVKVPASSANLGSGFDTLGMALSLYNFYDLLSLLPSGSYEIEVIGEGEHELEDPIGNLLIKSYERAAEEWGIELPGLKLRCLNAIPLRRGLGSSSSAVVGGVLLANAMRDDPLDKDELLTLMVSIEGHPDNVVPSCLGGMVVSSWDGHELRYVKLPSPPRDIVVVVAVPNVEVSTSEARQALPEQVSLSDAIFNVSRVALLAASWATGQWDHLPWAMEDRLHQQFRARLFPGGEEILDRVRSVPGCLGVAISGSGPSVMAFARENVQEVAEAACRTFMEKGVRSRFFVLDIDENGAVVEYIEPSLDKEEIGHVKSGR